MNTTITRASDHNLPKHTKTASRHPTPRAAMDRRLFAPQTWWESLEPRLLFNATAATLSLDHHFGNHGSLPGVVDAVAAAPDGSAYAILRSDQLPTKLIHFNPDGTFDRSFGGGNAAVVINPAPQDEGPNRLFIEPDGTVLFSSLVSDHIVFNRYTSAGIAEGTLRFGLSDNAHFESNFGFGFWQQPDGKIDLIYKLFNISSEFSTESGQLMLLRINTDGSPDLSIGLNGERSIDAHGLFRQQPYDGHNRFHIESIDATTSSSDGTTVAYIQLKDFFGPVPGNPDPIQPTVKFMQLRWDINGNLTSQQAISFEGLDGADNVSIQPDGRLLAFHSDKSGGAVIQGRLDGSRDFTFGGNGSIPALDYYPSFVVQPDGKIITVVSDVDPRDNEVLGGGLQRFNADGSPDLSFAGGQPAYNQLFYSVDSVFTLPNGSILTSVEKYASDTADDPITHEVVLVLPNGGTPNSFDLFARAPLYANELAAANYTGNVNGIMTTPTPGSAPTPGQSLFATAPGATLYNPKGSLDLLDD